MELVELAVGGEVIDCSTEYPQIWNRLRYQETAGTIRRPWQAAAEGSKHLFDSLKLLKSGVTDRSKSAGKYQRRWIVQANVKGRDISSVVADIQARVGKRSACLPISESSMAAI